MNRQYLLQGLEYVVQCRWGDGSWETIAAFNCEPVATRYWRDCSKETRSATYRVVELPPVLDEPEGRVIRQDFTAA